MVVGAVDCGQHPVMPAHRQFGYTSIVPSPARLTSVTRRALGTNIKLPTGKSLLYRGRPLGRPRGNLSRITHKCYPRNESELVAGADDPHKFGDLIVNGAAFMHLATDLFDGMNDRGVVSSTEFATNHRIRKVS